MDTIAQVVIVAVVGVGVGILAGTVVYLRVGYPQHRREQETLITEAEQALEQAEAQADVDLKKQYDQWHAVYSRMALETEHQYLLRQNAEQAIARMDAKIAKRIQQDVQILDLLAAGKSLRAIELAVFGYAGGYAGDRVRRVAHRANERNLYTEEATGSSPVPPTHTPVDGLPAGEIAPAQLPTEDAAPQSLQGP